MKKSNYRFRRLIFLFILTFVKIDFCSGDAEPKIVEDWAHRIGRKIHDFAVRNVTDSTAMETELANLQLRTKKINGTNLVNDISKNMHRYFDKKIKSLRNIVAKAEKVYENYKYDDSIQPFRYMDMRNYKSSGYNLTFALAFKQNVSFDESGVQVPTDIYDEAPEILNTIKWSASLDEVFINNFKEDTDLKWQFFGSETGVFRLYPAKKMSLGPKNIDLYDARKRPWYIHGSASPKTVVIMVDSSGSMYGRPMLIARLAIGELIDTLSENDYFNVLWFNKNNHTLACNNGFVQATTQNKQFFKDRLKEIKVGYVAAWSKAYEAAFDMLNESKGANCQKVIMVFTDGPTERSSEVFERYNGGKKVRVFTYAVGPPAHSTEALKNIACENKGYFYRIPGVGSVRDVIKGYVSVLSRPMAQNNTHDPIWSSVYLDASGLGMMVAGTLPVFHRPQDTDLAEILGVTGTDVPLDDIESLFDKASFGADGYFFLTNNNGHIVKHPAMKSNLGYLEDPPGVYISDIELAWDLNSAKPLELRKKMLEISSQQVGVMTFDVAKFSNDQFHRRVKKNTMYYYFTTVKNTPFRVGVATPNLGFKIVNYTGNLGINETISNFLENYWEKWVKKKDPGDVVELFVQTNSGKLHISRSDSNFKPEEGIAGRIEQYPDDITVLSVPHNSGKNNTENSIVTGYRKVKVNASEGSVYLAVVGFNVKHSRFHDDYFNEPSRQCEGYDCYLLDENAFIVAANANSEVATGQFLGNVDYELMKQLVTGGHSSMSNPIYEKVERKDYQGTCSISSDSESSSAPFLGPLFSVTSYFKWCAANVIWFIAQLNLNSWLFSKSTSASAETEIPKSTNRSCIMVITAYYANITETNMTQQGKANCSGCVDDFSECQRPFVVSKVPKTNLFLVVVNASLRKCKTTKTYPLGGIPGEPVEYVRSQEEQEESVCANDQYRKNIARCYISDDLETHYPCGACSLISVAVYVIFSTLLCILSI